MRPDLEVTEHLGLDRILTGNADIACSERGLPTPDVSACTLPIYPQPADLPQLFIVGGAACAP